VDDVLQLHHDAIVCDLHADTLQYLERGESLGATTGAIDLPRLRQGGVDLLFFSAWVDEVYAPQNPGEHDRSFARAVELLDAFDHAMQANAAEIAPVQSASEARAVIANGRIAAALGVEGGHAIESDLDKLEELYRRGVRYMTLTWNNSHDWADAAKEEALKGTRHGGLTKLGEEVVRRMNRLGMMVDLSHAAESTFWHVLRVSKAPVMASHSDAYALTPHLRNLKDEQIRALAERDGLIGINFYSAFLDAEYMQRRAVAEEERKVELDALCAAHRTDYPTGMRLEREVLQDEMGPVPVPASRIADHVMYMVSLVGPDHLALGSDFDGTNAVPDDLPDVSHLPLVTKLLRERGLSDGDIRKILGENALRFFATVCG
jgi:membrane dipeptidase